MGDPTWETRKSFPLFTKPVTELDCLQERHKPFVPVPAIDDDEGGGEEYHGGREERRIRSLRKLHSSEMQIIMMNWKFMLPAIFS